MKYSAKVNAHLQAKLDCLVVMVFKGNKLSASGQEINKQADGKLAAVVKRELADKAGQTLTLHHADGDIFKRILLVNCGDAKKIDSDSFVKISKAIAKALKTIPCKTATICINDVDVTDNDPAWQIKQVILNLHHAYYRFDKYHSKKKPAETLKQVVFNIDNKRNLNMAKKATTQGDAMTVGMTLTKDLGNEPCNVCTPSYLANTAKKLGKDYTKLQVSVLGEAQMTKLKMGSLLAVGQGSKQESKLITMNYKGGKTGAKPIVLVGKGVTFDTGGISLKGGAGMDEMKYDMCGAAAVFGMIKAICELQLPINVVGIVPSVENMPGSNAYRPGDILTSMSGQTIEITNTDAEGRLILCDALTYAKKFNPKTVINMATLTGGIIVALGNEAIGVMGNNKKLTSDLIAAGEQSRDRAWELPIWDAYQPLIDSEFADMKNAASRSAHSITAGCFLARFTKEYTWAHLDIAGTAHLSSPIKHATGRPIPLLMQYILNNC